MTTRTKDVRIASVKLIEGGLKGIEVKYEQTEVKGNREFFNEYTSKRKSPVHDELEKTFSWLKEHVLDICGYTDEEEERKELMQNLEMVSVSYGDKGFTLSAKLSVLDNKVVSLTTPLIADGNEYSKFQVISAILDGVYHETKEYMTGGKTMNDTELVLRFNAKKEDFDAEAFKAMPKEEREALATKILEDAGCIVLGVNDLEEGEEEAIKMEFKSEPNVKMSEEPKKFIIEEDKEFETAIDSKAKAIKTEDNKLSNSVATIKESEGGGFAIVLPEEPVKVSTAKRKAS